MQSINKWFQKIQELQVVDTTTASILLSFDGGVDGGLGGLTWTGGQGGGGVYFVPPFYPAVITTMQSYIVGDPNLVGFSMEIYDDNGIGGTNGTLLDSQTVAGGTVISNAWNIITLPTPITIYSGGVYVAWSMNGLGVALGEDVTAPFSNQTYEVVGSTWAIYRARETQDFMININIEKMPGAGIDEVTADNTFGEFYPNPSSSLALLNYDLSASVKNLSYQVYDVQG